VCGQGRAGGFQICRRNVDPQQRVLVQAQGRRVDVDVDA